MVGFGQGDGALADEIDVHERDTPPSLRCPRSGPSGLALLNGSAENRPTVAKTRSHGATAHRTIPRARNGLTCEPRGDLR